MTPDDTRTGERPVVRADEPAEGDEVHAAARGARASALRQAARAIRARGAR